MAHHRMESEEEALFRSYPYALYFVQSPSTISHANSNTNAAAVNYDHPSLQLHETDARLALSRYSSSRGSNNSFQSNHKKKYSHDQVHVLLRTSGKSEMKMNDVDHHGCDGEEKIDGDDDDDDYGGSYEKSGAGWMKYFSFSYSDSGWWILLQLSWRFLASLMIALLVFYIAAKPPPPKFSVKVAGIPQYRLGEGVDASGVTTKILSCNFSIDVTIDNDSKLFPLHIKPPIMKLIFGRLNFATSQVQGREVYAGNDDLTMVRFHVGTKNKPMYGAGRSMQDFLESGKGLPLIIRVSLRSRFYVIWGVFEPKYHHEAQCLVVLDNNYDKKHRTQVYNSTCGLVH